MKLTSKSILSPSHSREPPQMSLSSSFNRRLVSNSSTKCGQASPMFPSVGKKRGPGIDNPEPSSPKVTCIGQVRVKTRKQGKKMRARSKRRGGSIGEESFRKSEQNLQVGVNPDLSRQKSQKKNHIFQHQNLHQQEGLPHSRNQRWVHVPVAICEALKAFGSEFSCFFTCRSSCTREKEVKAEVGGSGGGHHREGSCGDSVARWLVTLQEDDNANGREIELVMGEEEDRTKGDNSPGRSHRRRHVFEDIDMDIEKLKNEDEEKARVSICIPPKNALLLMRCRSDPVKVAALANRFWEPTIQKEEEEQQVQMEEDREVLNNNIIHDVSEKGIVFVAKEEEDANATNLETNEVVVEEAKAKKEDDDVIAYENKNGTFLGATYSEEEKVKGEENDVVQSSELSSSEALPAPSEPQNNEVAAKGSTEEEKGSKEREKESKLERKSETLPECLLLMMCEPKLSMEVSRETWVCTADFVRCVPSRPPGKHGSGDRQNKKKSSAAAESKPPLAPSHPAPSIQPARSSCSFPAPAVVGSNGFEPLALTRCKSEPRKVAARLAPEGCSWNNRKLMEPHPPARLGF